MGLEGKKKKAKAFRLVSQVALANTWSIKSASHFQQLLIPDTLEESVGCLTKTPRNKHNLSTTQD